ncbi:MAG TPA: NADP-dependent malic enzyme [Mesotoga infera]|nr:NADP-dependent malic enzyme [Mesotoga infera]HOI35131.1 NADP-dependent malic enzyme [Mesotoga infera]HON26966.1 NADP-dependent malic enzyme [Mesotoga infera]HPD38840.1 NADP-dependent malic enzyme [Mesotoga infera]HRV02382.1 NADP-dependent malic enzyme [Mesotoga sp.]
MIVLNEEALKLHKELRGKLEVKSRVSVDSMRALSLAYTPGVADVCRVINENKELVYDYTNKWNYVAVVSDGTAVLGLGDIGPEAGMPVMEGKALLFKEFGNVDAFPLCINVHEPDEIIAFVQALSPTFGGVNLEDISSPKCFYIEQELQRRLDIPIFHDDQHGAAIVATAALRNALKIVGKNMESLKVATVGIGAAGGATIKMLLAAGIRNIVAVDRNGILNKDDPKTLLNEFHRKIVGEINPDNLSGDLAKAIKGADVFIGTSVGGIISAEMIRSMAPGAIVFALANPVPEIMPDLAKEAGAKIVATGRSDFPNQINNVLAFPGIFRGALDVRSREINESMKLAATDALADAVGDDRLSADCILPKAFEPGIARKVAIAVARASLETGSAKLKISPNDIEETVDRGFRRIG